MAGTRRDRRIARRPTNSPKWCYQVAPAALRLLRSYGSEDWERNLEKWRGDAESLAKRYARERQLNRIPVQLAEGVEHYLTPGKHSALIRAVVEEFAPRFVPEGKVLYIGDTGDKWAFFDRDALIALGLTLDEHGKMPDVVIHDEARDWLVLVEAVTSHGPVDPQRHAELAALFAAARPGLRHRISHAQRHGKTHVEHLVGDGSLGSRSRNAPDPF